MIETKEPNRQVREEVWPVYDKVRFYNNIPLSEHGEKMDYLKT